MIPLRDSQPSHSTPFVTIGLIVVNVVVFLYEISLDPFSANHLFATYAVVPADFNPATLLTSMFLHGGWMHLIGNMWFLWIYGDNVEDILGHGKYLLFYLLCGMIAAAAQMVTNPGSHVPMLGASGAIAGVMGAYLLKFPRSRIVTLIFVFVFITTVEIPASIMLLYWLAIQVLSGAGSIGGASGGGVAWFAHVGGFLAGMALILSLPTRRRFRNRREFQW